MQTKINKPTGFTIVELLIVIVVIGILAAITIVAFNGIQNRAHDTAVQSDLMNTAKKLELLKITLGTYPAQNDTSLSEAGISISKGSYNTTANNFIYCGSSTSQNFAIVATSKSGKTFAIASNRAFSEYTGYPVSDYASTCVNLIGTSAARYGFTPAESWRSWVN